MLQPARRSNSYCGEAHCSTLSAFSANGINRFSRAHVCQNNVLFALKTGDNRPMQRSGTTICGVRLVAPKPNADCSTWTICVSITTLASHLSRYFPRQVGPFAYPTAQAKGFTPVKSDVGINLR
ncbi:unnamed protein product, partial [Iphiclides podalirius]